MRICPKYATETRRFKIMRSKRDSVRKARERNLINKAKTLHPLGIN